MVLTLSEIIGYVYRLGGWLETDGTTLYVKGIANLPGDLNAAITRQKTQLVWLVGGFGGRWPAEPKRGL